MKNTLSEIFDEFNRRKIKYCIRGKYKHLPRTLNKGDIDMLIYRKDFPLAKKILRKRNFVFYPFTSPNLFYYYFDKNLGLIQMDILLSENFPEVKKFRNFFITKDEKPIPNRKSFYKKIFTGTRRRLYWSFNGPVIAFEGVDGSGKTTNVNSAFKSLKRLGLGKNVVKFSTPLNKNGSSPSRFKRFYTRVFSIIKVWQNKILGRMTITDRYIYLTLRKKNQFLRNILLFLTPRPTVLFITKAPISEIQKRKKGQRDFLSSEKIRELYAVYESVKKVRKVELDTTKPLNKNLDIMVNEILKSSLVAP